MTDDQLIAQQEVLQGYYNRIHTLPKTEEVEAILDWLESDLKFIRMEKLGNQAKNIVSFDPHTSGSVQCNYCNHCWVAVRPVGLTILECPKCEKMAEFTEL